MLFFAAFSACVAADAIVLKPGFQIYVEKDAPISLQNAIDILRRDIKNVLGQESIIINDVSALNASGAAIIVGGSEDLKIPAMQGFEAHKIFADRGRLIIQGADLRGTIFAVFTFSERFLGIKPLWYWACLQPQTKEQIEVAADFLLSVDSPSVKYRAWFPNDMDMFTPWRQQSDFNNGVWLETMLRLKLNTVNWNGAVFDKPYAVSDDFKLIRKYGLYVTFHHHNPMNACFSGWKDYWAQYKKQDPPQLLLSNEDLIKDYWRYNVQTLVKNGLDVIWVVNFRGNTDGPYWDTFKDAPTGMKERAEIINRMVRDQVEIIRQETGQSNPPIRMIFYNELSDLLAQGLLKPPVQDNLMWTFVAARRDHFPNFDIQQVPIPKNVSIGYYMNLQFTSTGSHLAQAEGPWKMEQNYRYVASKGHLAFSELNAGNLREHLLGLSANADMLWDWNNYSTDNYVLDFCSDYFGAAHAQAAAGLYKDFFNAYWLPKKSDLPGFDRQYIFQDLRYQKAIGQLAKVFFAPYNPNPLRDFPNEQFPGRTFRIEPKDNNADNQVDAILNGTRDSAVRFEAVVRQANELYEKLDAPSKPFFNDNLRAQANFMLNLNNTLYNYCLAYKQGDPAQRKKDLQLACQYAEQTQDAILQAAHDDFAEWYAQERIFNLENFVKTVQGTWAKARAQ